jgi:hypothetical protein
MWYSRLGTAVGWSSLVRPIAFASVDFITVAVVLEVLPKLFNYNFLIRGSGTDAEPRRQIACRDLLYRRRIDHEITRAGEHFGVHTKPTMADTNLVNVATTTPDDCLLVDAALTEEQTPQVILQGHLKPNA